MEIYWVKNEAGMAKAVLAIFMFRRNLLCQLQNLSVLPVRK